MSRSAKGAGGAPERGSHEEHGALALQRRQLALQLQHPHLDERVLLGAHALAAGAVVIGAGLQTVQI